MHLINKTQSVGADPCVRPQRHKEYIKEKLRNNEKFIVPYLIFGFPTIDEFTTILLNLADLVDLIEIGVPFSDPLADGSTIQAASKIALQNGANLEKLFEATSGLKHKINGKLILMSYLNTCHRYGFEKLFSDMKEAGFCAAIFPDLPYGEWNMVNNSANKHDIDIVYLLAPTTPLERAKKIMTASAPFTYAVTLKGVTGARTELPVELTGWLASLKNISSSPLFVGFGISKPEHIKTLRTYADGFIIGSALIQMIQNNKTNEIHNFIESMKMTLNCHCELAGGKRNNP
ncbi:MAG: tryptophan synthase subunit alpha [Candidatus Fischerbacteria bacterium RBG_13_37_8]|uniref:Tryptophan synthase alpha chain n=1 Tax=Candidatus Fischerbacteria bacterium RBG_13_37_8 TaxID=1817863 RepID=A0A1F5VD60_9BACT|nr:MAG: tryptophan synthase subunit alpha [Candidatus Fischerbacteria bacterium RBG_13_37_8]